MYCGLRDNEGGLPAYSNSRSAALETTFCVRPLYKNALLIRTGKTYVSAESKSVKPLLPEVCIAKGLEPYHRTLSSKITITHKNEFPDKPC